MASLFQKLLGNIRPQKQEEKIPVPVPETPWKTPEEECVKTKTVETEPEPESEPKECIITKLPGDVVFLIASHLTPASRMCLALTCKPFLEFIDGSKSLRKSFRLLNQKRDPFKKHRLPHITPRWELIILLETKNWRSCSDCLCLHPVSELSADGLCEDRRDLFDKRRHQRCHMGAEEEGYLSLCPCRKFTVRDMWTVFKKLSQPGVFQCQHCCLYKYNWDTISATVTATLQDANSLVIETEYYIPEVILPNSLRHVPRYCCPHRSIYQHLMDLREILHSPNLFPLADDYRRFTVCNQCLTSIVDVAWDGEESACTLKTRRTLEKGKLSEIGTYTASGSWNKQSTSGDNHYNWYYYDSYCRGDADDRNPWASWVPTSNGAGYEIGRVIFSTPALSR